MPRLDDQCWRCGAETAGFIDGLLNVHSTRIRLCAACASYRGTLARYYRNIGTRLRAVYNEFDCSFPKRPH